MFKVVTACCGQRGLQLGRTLLVGLSQPHTWLEVWRRSLSTAERLIGIDSVEQLPPHIGG